MNIRIKLIQALININENIFFYPKLRRFYEKINKSKQRIIIDVGANKGQSIEFFLKIFENAIIYAFEPNPKLYNRLIIKYQNKKNIKIYNLGVSDINGRLELNETITDETSTFEKLNYESNYLKMKANILGVSKENIIMDKYFVEVIQLSEFIKKESITKVDILKIDTEGHELNCLRGLFNQTPIEVTMIQIESHNDDMYMNITSKEEIPNLLSINGYKNCTKIKHGFGDFNEHIYSK
jgi:FkbM family methyltransferase